jgi:heat shock protein HslJ
MRNAYGLRPLLCSLALLLVSGCQMPAAQGAGTPLDALPTNSDWALTSASAAGLNRPEAALVRLHIEGERLSGDSGCNRFSASYSISAGKLSIGPVVASKRGCPSAAGEVEQALFAALQTLTSASMDGVDLLLEDSAGGQLRLSPAVADEK